MRYEIKNIPKHRDNFVHSPLNSFIGKKKQERHKATSLYSLSSELTSFNFRHGQFIVDCRPLLSTLFVVPMACI